LPPLGITRLGLFPFAANLVESVGADLELVTQPAENRGFLPIRFFFERARNEIGPLPLRAVIDEMVLPHYRAQTIQSLWVYARPKESEVADMPIDFATSPASGG